ncbi:MAG: protease modulator HflC [Symbiobacterium sp.]|uniref:protease modulator HflC n=1 Tax=Symbiobacterium sp. TaxID=1971213 RepID=UPI0034643ACD
MNPNREPIELRLNVQPGDVKRLLIWIAAIALVFGALSQIIFVREDEYLVVRSWTGVVQRIQTEAGPTFKIPLLQSVQTLPKQRMIYDSNPADVLTADQKPIIVDYYTVWQITDPLKFVQNTQTTSRAEQRIDAAVYSTVRGVLGRLKFGEIISEGESARGDLNAQVTAMVNDLVADYGITVHDVRLKRTDLPEQNLESVFNRMKSERSKIAQDYLSQGDEQAANIRARTDKEATLIISEARRRAAEIEAEGEAEAARIYNEAYGADPEFYAFYRTLESYKTTLNGKPTIVIPIDSPYAKLLMGE